jgi:hypothetical protein
VFKYVHRTASERGARKMHRSCTGHVADVLYHPPCDCPICRHLFHPYIRQASRHNNTAYKSRLANHEAQAMTWDLTRDINESRSYLKNQCSKHGALISSKWTNKKPQKRAELLLEMDSTMYGFQWGEARLCYEFRNRTGDIGNWM